MFSTGFWRDLLERALATFAQALAAVLIADGAGLLEADWVASLSAAGMAALLAVLKGVGAYGIDRETGASLLPSPPPRVEGSPLSGHDDLGHANPYVLALLAVLVVVVLVLVL